MLILRLTSAEKEREQMTDTSIAQTILRQLGGNVFTTMTGARQFTNHGNALSFKLPSNFAKNGINYCKITLELSDTYTVEFKRIRGMKVNDVSRHDDIYNDSLTDLFRRETGLETRMPRFVGAA